MTGSEALPPSCTQKHKKRNEERGAEAPSPPSPSIVAGNKASPPNYTHKKEKVKKGEYTFNTLR
jgi:hypothetical protein